MNLQVHDLKLRQYTDYDTRTGTPRSPFFSPAIWTGNTFGERETLPGLGPPNTLGGSSVDSPNAFNNFVYSSSSGGLAGLDEYGIEEVGPMNNSLAGPPLSILDVFAIKTITGALNEPGVMTRMRHFADTRGRARDIDFLLKVEEYTNAIKTVETLLSDASLKLAGIAGAPSSPTSPVKLPLKTTRALTSETRDATTNLLPRLDGVFDDAKGIVEQSLAQDMYPDFVKSQLSLSLQTIGPGYSPNQVCPGFGEAFCMTNPHDADNPVMYTSDGLAGLTGYSVGDIVKKNCRFMQGPGTRASGVDRIRVAMAQGKEVSELVLNFKKDGRPFWNLMFVAPLLGANGEVVYQLGGQIDVTEMLETQEDVACVLSYVPPLVDGPSPQQTTMADDQGGDHNQQPALPPLPGRHSSNHSLRGRRRDDKSDAPHSSKYPPNASRNKFFRGFLRRYSSASTSSYNPTISLNDGPTDIPSPPPGLNDPPTHQHSVSASSTPTVDSRKSLNIPSAPVTQAYTHQVMVSPYSRFMVLEYIPPSTSQNSSSGSGGVAAPNENSKKSTSRHLQLPVAFCSPAAFECLGNGARSIADVVGTSIFDVLSDKGTSPSITKSFKSNVRASLAEGRNAKLDVTLNGGSGSGGRARARGSSLSRRNNSAGLMPSQISNGISSASEIPNSHGKSIRTSMSLERLVNRRNSAETGADYVSYWTPLRDESGHTQYVVLILVPEVS